MIIMGTNDDYRIILSLFRLGMNVIQRGCTDCRRQYKKAICLGEEQAFLLKLLFTDNLQWDIQNQELHILDKEFKDFSLRCTERPKKKPILWNEQLSKAETDKETENAEDDAEENAIICYIQSQHGNFRYWNKICEPIVLTLAINSCNNVVDRDTLIHLCMNSRYGAVLFRKIIMKILSLLVANWFDCKKQEEIAKFLCDFLKELTDYEYRSDLEKNIEARRDCLRERIQGSDIDMLYKEVRAQQDRDKIKWEKGGDILKYFANMEHKPRIYYASRLALIQRILVKKDLQKELWLPDNLIQLNNEREDTNYTKKIREVIDSIDAQDECRQKEAVKKLSRMIDLCVMDWIDEEVTSVYEWVLAG